MSPVQTEPIKLKKSNAKKTQSLKLPSDSPKRFKQKTKIDDQLMAKDLLIEELRIHLNFISKQNQVIALLKFQLFQKF